MHKHPCNLQIETIDMYEKKSSLNTIKVMRLQIVRTGTRT